ncbi:MAG: 3-phosphoshikimate 1-carboxyvinyltransferase [Maricaulaceae bacterium]
MTDLHTLARGPVFAPNCAGLNGNVRAPGDKSLSHRAILFGALAEGETRVQGLLEGADILATIGAVRALGADVTRSEDGVWRVASPGHDRWRDPADVLDFGNAGTGVRLTLGAVAGAPVTATVTGDESLRARPMSRVLAPLKAVGAQALARGSGYLPLTLQGAAEPKAQTYAPPIASAQVKSAVLLAGLRATGATVVEEAHATRDHTENLLLAMGADLSVERDGPRARIQLAGPTRLNAIDVTVPGDPSSAAFPIAAALICLQSAVSVSRVLLNPHRTGLYDTLRDMGADMTIAPDGKTGGEPVGVMTARFGTLKGVEVPLDRVPAMVDEFPILAVIAAFAEGRTVMRGLAELRVKESDRLAATAALLRANGVTVEDLEDGLVVEGRGPAGVPGGGVIETHHDHRIAMAGLVLGLAAQRGATIDDASMIATSFPNFFDLMTTLGARFEPAAMS